MEFLKRNFFAIFLALCTVLAWRVTQGPLTTSNAAQAPAPAVSPSYNLVPPSEGSWDTMWAPLKQSKQLYVPVYGLDDLSDVMEKNSYASMPWKEFGPHALRVQSFNKRSSFDMLAVYSDEKLLNTGTIYQNVTPRDILHAALNEPNLDGVFFNARSRACDKAVFGYGVNRHYLAELVGYLEAPTDEGDKPWHELALAAEAAGQLHQVLYYWGRSYRQPRQGDDWKKAEFAKIRAYHALNYPGARERAVTELKWFVDTHGRSPEANALMKVLS